MLSSLSSSPSFHSLTWRRSIHCKQQIPYDEQEILSCLLLAVHRSRQTDSPCSAKGGKFTITFVMDEVGRGGGAGG